MKRKILKMCSGIILTVTLMVTSMLHYDSQVTAADQIVPGVIKVAPENMLNVQVVDKNGNQVYNISASLKNTSGSTVASWTTGSQDVNDVSGIGITGNTYFNEPIETLKKLVAPCPFVGSLDINNSKYMDSYSQDSVRFNAGEQRAFRVDYYNDYPTALTVPKDNYAIVVDSAWSSRDERLFLKSNQNEVILNQIAGTTQYYQSEGQNAFYPTELGVKWNNRSDSKEITLWRQYEQGEYVKMRIKLSDYLYYGLQFNDDGTYTVGYRVNGSDSRYVNYNFGKENIINDSGAVGILCIESGSVLNLPIPDEDGYVDIYVDKSSRKIWIYAICIWSLNGEDFETSSIFEDDKKYPHSSGSYYNVPVSNSNIMWSLFGDIYDSKTYTLQAVDFPDEGTTLSYVPAGNYTLELSNVPQQYKQPTVQNVTIAESQDVHMLKVVLEDAPHTHTADESRWLSDSSDHWHKCSTCDENVKLDSAAHTAGAEATETSPQTCTICGYEIAPKLEHVHDYGDTYKTDTDNHWKECGCGDVTERATHNFAWITDKEATESEGGSKHEECTVCGYKKYAVEIPALNPTEPSTEAPTEPSTEAPTQKPEQPTQKQEPATQKQSSEKQSNPVTGDNYSSVYFIVIIACVAVTFACIAVFWGNVYKRNKEI